MDAFTRRNFAQPDEVMDYPAARMELVSIGDHLAWRLTCEPGWRYSESMGPADGAELCPGEHRFMMITSGRLAVRMEDGTLEEYGPGDIGSVPPGHEPWVVGDEPLIAIGIDGGTG
jgi:hypothetical protein